MKRIELELSEAELARVRASFQSKVDTAGPVPEHASHLGPCHVWTGSRQVDGRGKMKIRGKDVLAHRVAFLLAHGRWPTPCALHKCDGGPIGCVRADHLREGTYKENTADMLAKGRDRPGGARGVKNPKAKLTPALVSEIRAALAAGESQRSVAARFGIGKSNVGAIALGRTWRGEEDIT